MYLREFSPSVTFTAAVITSNAGTGAVTVCRESYGGANGDMGMTMQGIVVSSAMASFLGFRQSVLPQPGSRVLCAEYTSSQCYIIGIIPDQVLDVKGLSNRAMLGAGDASADSANNKGFSKAEAVITDAQKPSDVVDGEYVVSNEFGVLLGLYQQLANLKASELAQIQCFLLDDMVRIISHNFQHYTALGEYNIYHDGKALMAEFGATHKPSESYGSPAIVSNTGLNPTFKKTGQGATPDDSKDHFSFTADERTKAIERFKIFLGSLGDFLHMFVVRPNPTETRALDPSSQITKPDTGLCDVHIGTDGGMHIRSIKEVFIEKTNWIRVPHRKSSPDDPNGDDANNLNYDKKELFKFKNDAKYLGNPFAYSLALRDYVAYVNEKLGYQNFKKHKKDFHVNDDVTKEENLKNIKEVDPETELGLKDYQLRTAGIYLMPNGGITIRDAWNSAIVMEGGNISLQPAKDLVSQPLRHNIVKAGGSVSIVSKKHMDISSSEEGVRIKSEKNSYIYSNSAGVIIEANGNADTPGYPAAGRALEYVGGVVIKSSLGIYNFAQKNILNYANENIYLESLKSLEVVADSWISLYGKKSLYMFAGKSILGKAGKTDKEGNSSGSVSFISEGTASFAGQDKTYLGQYQKPVVVSGAKLTGVIKIQEYIQKAELKKFLKSRKDLVQYTIFKKDKKKDDYAKKLADIKFRFLESFQYGQMSNPVEDAQDGIMLTLAQQDDLLTSLYGLDFWQETNVNGTYPYPGTAKGATFLYSIGAPVNLTKSNSGKDFTNKADPKNEAAPFTRSSLFGAIMNTSSGSSASKGSSGPSGAKANAAIAFENQQKLAAEKENQAKAVAIGSNYTVHKYIYKDPKPPTTDDEKTGEKDKFTSTLDEPDDEEDQNQNQ